MIAVDTLTGQRRPSSGAFKPDLDGVSVYRESKLRSAGLVVSDLVTAPQNVVVGLPVGEIRSVTPLGTRDDEIDPPQHPRDRAHALIVGWRGLSKSQRRERQGALARLPSLEFIYP